MSLPVFQPITYGAHAGTIADFATTGGFTVVTPTGAGAATGVGVSDVLAGHAKAAGNTVTAVIESATASATPSPSPTSCRPDTTR